MESREIRPQSGPQEIFLSTEADIAIYGGSAGSGKTYALLLEPLRHITNSQFSTVIFRRTSPQIRAQGGLWEVASDLYTSLGELSATLHETFLQARFPSGAIVKFSHMEHDKNRLDWQGSQIPLICFDELTHFSQQVFFYMLSRNRSTSGIRPYIRATCNPEADSWVSEFISWWIDEETGFPIKENAGKLRWFVRINDKLLWANSKQEIIDNYAFGDNTLHPKSVTFIPALVTDNKILLEKDPGYVANLDALPYVERMQLKEGNWKIKPASGLYFKRGNVQIVDAMPAIQTIEGIPVSNLSSVRYWDRASTEKRDDNNPDWTRGVKMTKHPNGKIYIEHLASVRGKPFAVENLIKNTASQDTKAIQIGIEQDPGQAGVADAANYVRLLAGYNVRVYPVNKNKVTRALAYSSQWEAGNIVLIRGSWNEEFLTEHEAFPPQLSNQKDDIVDASSGAFNVLHNKVHLAGLDNNIGMQRINPWRAI
jgi:predicted phage terminase large subunit-like protein